VLVHGLASNAQTWNAVAGQLNAAGRRVVAVDQRGHGLSDKPDSGYDFDEVTADLLELLARLNLEKPIIAGQSWGGNVALDFAGRYPEAGQGVVLVDGGFIELSAIPGATWERIEVDLKPPSIAGVPRSELAEGLRSFHPEWTEEGIEATLANFETLPDGTARPWLALGRHMMILRSLWEHRPSAIYPRVAVPVLLAASRSDGTPGGAMLKGDEVARAMAGLRWLRVKWFDDADHDIHVHRPGELAEWMLQALEDGFFG
jgi:pimeloyl-ACP methyl ester carboxylesterase